jgi:uncharacterized membrane protein
MDHAAPPPQELAARRAALLSYILFALGLFIGLTSLIGLIVAYVKRPDARGTIYASHLTWLIRTFWISLLVGAICTLLLFIGIGYLGFIVLTVWYVYRLIRGFMAYSRGAAAPVPA